MEELYAHTIATRTVEDTAMKILNSAQIREADSFTISTEPIASIDLMERASRAFVDWFTAQFNNTQIPVYIICGAGNNGGDGLAAARLLYERFYTVEVVLCKTSPNLSRDCQLNLDRLPSYQGIPVHVLEAGMDFPQIPPGAILIDALFGSGLNRPLEGYWAALVEHISAHTGSKVAIDLPSGLFSDGPSTGTVFCADYTCTFQLPKLAFLFPENHTYVGSWTTVDIGLHPTFLQSVESINFYTAKADVSAFLRPRSRFAHKGIFGHALLYCGSYGMAGAAILAARACLHTGAGLVTVHSAASNRIPLQTAVPEAMFQADTGIQHWSETTIMPAATAIGAGCGIGQQEETARALEVLLHTALQPLVLDADALNIIAQHGWQTMIPKGSILTPHPKEFERLFGATAQSFERLELQRRKAVELEVVILLKGAFTSICLPDGTCHFNATGNPGMATAGSGDVLTGIITGLLAQGYSPGQSAILGAWLHGLAGDIAATTHSMEALTAGDIIAHLGAAFHSLKAE